MKNIECAGIREAATVKRITHQTIEEVYPHYYPKGAVDFFLLYHNAENILTDIKEQKVFLIYDTATKISAGTVTVKENGIYRLFVLPEYQGKGFGQALMEFAEQRISSCFDVIHLDSSLPAKEIYRKAGYRETASHSIRMENGDFLCYDEMIKKVR